MTMASFHLPFPIIRRNILGAVALSSEEVELYDRQLRLWGAEAQARMKHLFIGISRCRVALQGTRALDLQDRVCRARNRTPHRQSPPAVTGLRSDDKHSNPLQFPSSLTTFWEPWR
jgi:hypothetical protein